MNYRHLKEAFSCLITLMRTRYYALRYFDIGFSEPPPVPLGTDGKPCGNKLARIWTASGRKTRKCILGGRL